MNTVNYNSPKLLPVFNTKKTGHNSPLLFSIHVPYIFIIFITTNKHTINIPKMSLYIINTPTCFDISISSSGSPTFEP